MLYNNIAKIFDKTSFLCLFLLYPPLKLTTFNTETHQTGHLRFISKMSRLLRKTRVSELQNQTLTRFQCQIL